MKKTILVAGGAGFIGSHLCEYLLSKENNVTAIDNLSTGSKKNIAHLIENPRFIFEKRDVSSVSDMKECLKSGFDQIYHLASPASVDYIMKYPVEAAVANSAGTASFLDFARKANIPFLFASSSEAYGDPKEHPQKETYWGNVNSVGVRSGYDEGKRFGEALCMAYNREMGVNTKIVRIFNTYGPRSSIKDTRVIPQFVRQALRNEPLTVHGDGSQTRSFCYVDDMVLGFVNLMESNIAGPINIGNPEEHSIIDVARKIIKMTDSKSKIKFIPRPKDDPSVRRPDITLAKEKLNWSPAVSFDMGLEKTIAYFKSVL